MPRQILLIFLLSILSVQLVSLEPSLISVRERSFGALVAVSNDAVFYTNKIYTNATLATTQNDREHDSLLFVGDVMLGRHVETLLNQYGSDYPYTSIALKTMSSHPAIVANFESAINSQHTQTPYYTMRFSVDATHLPAFAKEFTHASLANNHSFDFGTDGYANAISVLAENRVESFGHARTIGNESISLVNTSKGSVALIGINATAKIPENDEISYVCTRAKRQSDFQVFFVHWGDEYETTHSETQKILAELLISECADLVIGHHPHVVQDIDIIDGVPVFYSLGNYIFDQYFSKEVQQGLVVHFLFDEAPVLELLPVTSESKKSVPQMLSYEETGVFLKELAERSHPSLRESIINGRINLFEPVATSSKMAIMSR